MIIGIGTDMVQISRIEQSRARSGDALARRVLTPEEMARYRDSAKPSAYLAKRFAAKEAAVKALGTGIGKVSWQDLEITNNGAGAPLIACRGNAREIMDALGAGAIHVSLSDEGDFALAFVVISGT